MSGSVPLTTTTDAYPLWFTSRPVLLASGAPVHYKYCVVADGRLVRSETIEGTRYMLPQGACGRSWLARGAGQLPLRHVPAVTTSRATPSHLYSRCRP